MLGIETYEIRDVSRRTLALAVSLPGHYTAKVDPRSSKKLLHEFGFYYCDSLVEPHCDRAHLIRFACDDASVSGEVPIERLLAVCHGAFSHDRFHRDFNLDPAAGDLRYDRWLRQMHGEGQVHALLFKGELAGFIALRGNRLVLHAVAESHRGKGLAKYLWSAACAHFFDDLGLESLESSISTTNLPVLNLYASLGFRFRNAVDVYHRLVEATATHSPPGEPCS